MQKQSAAIPRPFSKSAEWIEVLVAPFQRENPKALGVFKSSGALLSL
jgi:hypothetical protein